MNKTYDVDDKEKSVFNAIESPKYKARTVHGIAKEVKLDENDVKEILKRKSMMGRVVEVPGLKKNGASLFVSLERYKKKTPLSVRIINVFSRDRSYE